MERDERLQIRVLKGLIVSSKKLGLDPARYQKALARLDPSSHLGFRSSSSKRAIEADRKKRRSSKSPSTSSFEPLHLLRIMQQSGAIKLLFDSSSDRLNIKQWRMKKKGRLLYVFDLSPAVTEDGLRRFFHAKFEVRIAQFHRHTVRLVVDSKIAYRPYVRKEDRFCVVSLPTEQGQNAKTPSLKTAHKAAYMLKQKGRPKPSHQKGSSLSVTPLAVSQKPSAQILHATMRSRRYTVVIDPGHGGKDSGAVGSRGRKEKDAVLAVAKRLREILKKRGFKVLMTRLRDVFIPLKNRTRYANKKGADFFISIHANAAPNKRSIRSHRGIETYFLSPARSGRAKRVAALENRAEIKNIDRYTKNAFLSVLNREKIIESNKLAIDLQWQVLAALRSRYKGVVDNGVREGPFWVLVGAQMPAVLIEIGYITHPIEGKRLFSARYQSLLAEGIANGLESYIRHTRR